MNIGLESIAVNQWLNQSDLGKANWKMKEKEMKKLLLLSAGFLVLFFYGCNTSQYSSSAPGHVLDSSGGRTDNHNVVTFYVTGK